MMVYRLMKLTTVREAWGKALAKCNVFRHVVYRPTGCDGEQLYHDSVAVEESITLVVREMVQIAVV